MKNRLQAVDRSSAVRRRRTKFQTRLFGATLLVLAFLILQATQPGPIIAQSKSELQQLYPDLTAELNNGMEGRRFYLAFPPNEGDGISIINQDLTILVNSRFDTEVTLEVPGLGIGPITKNVLAGQTTSFSVAGGELSWAMEVRQSETVVDKVIQLTALKPITARAYSAKRFSSDGFLVRPVANWGQNYRHQAYYDYPEGSNGLNRAGGFLVIAQADSTEVNIELNGTRIFGTTALGKQIGQSLQITLKRNQLYMLRGNAEDQAFDLTGTLIRASKPIAVIAFHQRTVIPAAAGINSRDALMEMLTPIEASGSTHISRELMRNGKGDYFRIMALEPLTDVELNYYEATPPHALVGSRTISLSEAGDWSEFEEVNPTSGTESIRGFAVWTSNKPTSLMQYSYSNFWDNSENFDPFMMQVPPTEQYLPLQSGSSVDSPSESATSRLNVMLDLETNADDPADCFAKVLFNNTTLAELLPNADQMRVPGTNVFALVLTNTTRSNNISSPFKTALQMYGYTAIESFGWSDLHATNFLRTNDVLPPDIQRMIDPETPDEISLTALEEKVNDTGVAAFEFIPQYSQNMRVESSDDLSFAGYKAAASIRVSRIDLGLPAKTFVLARDRAGNVAVQSYFLPEGEIVLSPSDQINFGLVRVSELKTQTMTLTNTNLEPVILISFSLRTDSGMDGAYSVETGIQFPSILAPGADLTFTITYAPLLESALDSIPDDLATLTIRDESKEIAEVKLRGQGGIARATYDPPLFDTTQIGDIFCRNNTPRIINNGTYPLELNSIEPPLVPFTFNTPLPQLPLIIPPGNSTTIGQICFSPTVAGEFNDQIQITGNAANPENLRIPLQAIAVEVPDPVDSTDTPRSDEINVVVIPGNQLLQFQWIDAPESTVTIELFDIRGARLQTISAELLAREDRFLQIDLRRFSNGYYLFSVMYSGVVKSGTFTYVR